MVHSDASSSSSSTSPSHSIRTRRAAPRPRGVYTQTGVVREPWPGESLSPWESGQWLIQADTGTRRPSSASVDERIRATAVKEIIGDQEPVLAGDVPRLMEIVGYATDGVRTMAALILLAADVANFELRNAHEESEVLAQQGTKHAHAISAGTEFVFGKATHCFCDEAAQRSLGRFPMGQLVVRPATRVVVFLFARLQMAAAGALALGQLQDDHIGVQPDLVAANVIQLVDALLNHANGLAHRGFDHAPQSEHCQWPGFVPGSGVEVDLATPSAAPSSDDLKTCARCSVVDLICCDSHKGID